MNSGTPTGLMAGSSDELVLLSSPGQSPSGLAHSSRPPSLLSSAKRMATATSPTKRQSTPLGLAAAITQHFRGGASALGTSNLTRTSLQFGSPGAGIDNTISGSGVKKPLLHVGIGAAADDMDDVSSPSAVAVNRDQV